MVVISNQLIFRPLQESPPNLRRDPSQEAHNLALTREISKQSFGAVSGVSGARTMVTRLQKLYLDELQSLKIDLENAYTSPEAENYAIQKILDDGNLVDCTSIEDLSVWMRSTGNLINKALD